MRKYIFILSVIALMFLSSGYALAAGNCCVKKYCQCVKGGGCCVKGECGCNGGCCSKDSCNCADGKCAAACNCSK
ncbi:MAG: hypothetical protein V1869_06025 [Candidatus Omnitrophota bacterium]